MMRACDALIGATLNIHGSLVMQAQKIGSATLLAQIVQMVVQAQRSKAPMQRLADVIPSYFVIVVITIASLTPSAAAGGSHPTPPYRSGTEAASHLPSLPPSPLPT